MNKHNYLNLKTKSYYAGVALVALMSVSSPLQAMEVPQEVEPKDNKISRVRCLWNLEKKASKNKVYRSAALEILEKVALQEQADPKIRLNYLKKLGQFLKEHPQHHLDLEMMKIGKENEETAISKFYQEALCQIEECSFSSAEKALQVLKLKIFYSKLPLELTKMDIQKHQTDINQTLNKMQRIRGVDGNNLKYLKSYYFESPSNIKDLEKLTALTVGTLLGGKINFKLGLNIPEDGHVCGISVRAAYYETANNTPYSLVKYHLAELYNTPSSEVAGFYLPKSAYDLYADIVKEGNVTLQGKPLAAYPLAAYKIAKLLETGDNAFDLVADKEEALYWHTQAAIHGHPYAQYELAKHYIILQKEEEAIDLFHQAAESGYSKAQLELAQKYGEGYGNLLPKDPKLARHWYHKAAEQEEGEAANYPLGLGYELDGDYEKAISFYEKSKDPRADVRLGKMYLEGTGKEKSDILALAHFQKAASQGNADANYYLGMMKFKGQGFSSPLHKEAFEHFSRAAEQNHFEALFQLGVMKQFSIGTEKDYVEAKKLYEKCGSPAALYNLGWLYKQSLGVNHSIGQALTSWEKSADLGYIDAVYKVGKTYLNAWSGLDLSEKDQELINKAHFYFQKAATAGHIDAVYLLARMQEKGIGCEKNSEEAIKLYIQAADAGNASAQFRLGKHYEKTLEACNSSKAFDCYTLAATQNHVEARLALGKLYQEGRGTPQNRGEAFACFEKLDKEISPSILSQMKQLAKKEQLAKEDHKPVISWFREKAEHGNPHAKKFLGKLSELRTQGPQDTKKAIEYYQQAANQGKRSALRRLLDLKKVHLFEALEVEENMIFPTTFLKKDEGLIEPLLNEQKVLEESTTTATSTTSSTAGKDKIFATVEKSFRSSSIVENSSDKETEQCIAKKRNNKTLKTNSYVKSPPKINQDLKETFPNEKEVLEESTTTASSTTPSTVGADKTALNVKNGSRNNSVVEKNSDAEKKQYIEYQENYNTLKTKKYINAVNQNLTDGNDNIAAHLEGVLQEHLDAVEDFRVAVEIDSGVIQNSTQEILEDSYMVNLINNLPEDDISAERKEAK